MSGTTKKDYCFYKIINMNSDIDLCYVGSTANFKERVRSHRKSCNNEKDYNYNSKVYKTIREHGGWCEFKMIEIGTAQQLTKKEAHKIEEDYRVELKANMNMRKCYGAETEKEYLKQYYIENIDKRKKYIADNAEKIKESNKKYNTDNADNIKVYHKQYRANNIDKLKENSRQFYIKNGDKLKEKFNCECGGKYTYNNIAHHQKTQLHQNFINNKIID